MRPRMDIRAADLKAMHMMSSIVYILLLLVTHTTATSLLLPMRILTALIPSFVITHLRGESEIDW